MDQPENIYVKLQRHLNRQAVGFPATRSGVELKILKHIFTPEEARIALCLSYRPEPLETVYSRAAGRVDSSEALARVLDGLQKKGGIETNIRGGRRFYCLAPLVVGMYEMQLERLTPEFIRDFDEYTADINFGLEFLGTKLPQMRTIPVSRSISLKQNVGTFDEVSELLQQSEGPFVILECICRKKKALTGSSCKATDRQETCLALGSTARMVLLSGSGREIDRSQAVSIIEQNQKQGLVLQPSNTRKADFICSCCGCCCGMLGLHRSLPKPVDFWVSNFYAAVDPGTCNGCGICEKNCQVAAVRVSSKKETAVVDRTRCIGCGVCVTACPVEALSLVKKPHETVPPETREELYDIIMAGKKGRLAKYTLMAKLIFDTVRTGRPRSAGKR